VGRRRVEGARVDVAEHGARAGGRHGVGGGHETHRGQHDLVSGAEAEEFGGEEESGRGRVDEDRVFRRDAQVLGEPRLELPGAGAVSKPVGGEHF
jgi:hypothetical protein